MKRSNFILALLLLVLLGAAAAAVVFMLPDEPSPTPEHTPHSITISEISGKNETIIADNGGKYRDYVELHNTASTPADLTGFCLTDGKEKSPPLDGIVLEPGEYRIFFLGDDLVGFAISASGGDCVQLLDGSGRIVFQANTTAVAEDQVLALQGSSYVLTMDATPGFSNDAAGREAFLTGSEAQSPALVINEVLLGNVSTLPDPDGSFSDLVELRNTTDQPVQLGRYFLSDSRDNRFRYRLPDVTLAAGDCLLLFCDGGNRTDSDGFLHTNFALSHLETLCLTDHLGSTQAVEVSYAGDDVSQSLTENGWELSAPTPGFANSAEGLLAFRQSRVNDASPLVISEVLLSSAGVPWQGQFADLVELTNRSGSPVSTGGWFLSDGGDPRAYPLPDAQLQPGETLVILCSQTTTGFSLSDGETICLTEPSLLTASQVICGSETGSSLSRLSGEDGGYVFAPPSPGYPNDEAGQLQYQLASIPGLRFSELMSRNSAWLKGSYGVTCDWLELYNGSEQAVTLSGYALTDDPDEPEKYTLPEITIGSGEYLVVLLSEDPTNLIKGYPVIPMGLSAAGEQLYLTQGGLVEDYVLLPALDSDAVWGRRAGDGCFALLSQPTPMSPNAEEALLCAEPVALTPQGVYNAVEYVDVELSGEGPLYYTLGGDTPDENATLYTGPIRLTETTALRVQCRVDGKIPSKILDLTYVINEQEELDVVTLVTDPDNLFSYYTGIYTAGIGGETGEYPYYTANYWNDWERPATVSLFPQEGEGFSEGCGIKIHGAFSRAQEKKSLAVLFRGSYGSSELVYPLFGEDGLDTYEAFVLRSGGQDAFMARMRDEVITSLASDYTDLAVQRYRPVVLYINGNYWGLHFIREKISEQFVAGNYNVRADEVILAEGNGGASEEYLEMVRFAATHDMRKQENYDHLCSLMDVEQYTDYIIAQICIGNTDNSNVKFFKAGDGKWTWILYDTDLAMRFTGHDTVAAHLNPAGSGSVGSLHTTLINALLRREEYKEYFLTRFAWQLNNIWSEEQLLGRIDAMEQLLDATVQRDCQRWRRSYEDWQSYVRSLRYFAHNRQDYLHYCLRNYFSLSTDQMRQYGFNV